MIPLSYLHISGTLAENMVYRPRPGHESTQPGARGEGDPAYQLLLLDRDGQVLVNIAPQVVARGCGSAADPRRWRVRAALPLHPDSVRYELRRGEISLHAAPIPLEPPKIPAFRHQIEADGLALEWNADGKDHVTYSIVLAMDSGRRITLARNLTGSSHSLDLRRMPEHGRGTVYLITSDGVRSSEVEVTTIVVPARPPTVHILLPETNSPLPFGQPLSVLGACLDMSGRPCPPEPAVWTMDGERFATGSFVAALDEVPSGTHHLTLAYGDGNHRVECSVKVEIEEPHPDYHRWRQLMAHN
jgi:hypothetical protein